MKNFNLEENKQRPPFGVPEGYFENFAEKLESRIQGENVPLKVNKTLPFSVPEGYFELLPQYIAKRIEAFLPKVWYQQSSFRWSLASIGLATVVIMVWFNFFGMQNLASQANQELTENLKTIPKEELIQYLAYHKTQEVLANAPENVSLETVEQSVISKNQDSVLKKLPTNIKTEDILDTDIKQQDLENFIEEEISEKDLENILNP
jgi:hypothetical protein